MIILNWIYYSDNATTPNILHYFFFKFLSWSKFLSKFSNHSITLDLSLWYLRAYCSLDHFAYVWQSCSRISCSVVFHIIYVYFVFSIYCFSLVLHSTFIMFPLTVSGHLEALTSVQMNYGINISTFRGGIPSPILNVIRLSLGHLIPNVIWGSRTFQA